MLSFLRTPTVRFLKMQFEFAYYSFVLIHLELKRQIRPCTPEFPRKPYANSDQNRQSLCPFSNQNSTKTIPFGAAHTFKANIREYLSPPLAISLDEITWEDRNLKQMVRISGCQPSSLVLSLVVCQ